MKEPRILRRESETRLSGNLFGMNAGLQRILIAILICAGSLGLSYFTNDFSRLLVAIGIAYDLQTPEYGLLRLVMTDMLLQTIYFTFLTIWTGRTHLLLILAAVHFIDVVMCLRYGSPFLWASVVGAPIYFGAKL